MYLIFKPTKKHQIKSAYYSMRTIAQLTYIPLSEDDPREKVQDLLEHLAQYDVEIEVGYLSSTIIGAPKEVFKVVQDLYDIMALETDHFRFQVDFLSPSKEN
jgi:uncharacterized protein YqgV (UPF0045/DUF77 family)